MNNVSLSIKNIKPLAEYALSKSGLLLNRLKLGALMVAYRSELVFRRDIEFCKYGDRSLTMNILYRKRAPVTPMPCIVWIHGGGWRLGCKNDDMNLLFPFAYRGYFCASIDYRLSHEALFPAQIQDCKCAIRFLRHFASEFGIDPNRIGAWGSSAGGHLAALLGTTHQVKEFDAYGDWRGSSQVQAVCDWFGPTDFLRMNDVPGDIDHNAPNSPESELIGCPIQSNQEKAAQANPITYITSEASPFLIMHADNDPFVPLSQSQLLQTALLDAGVEATLEIIRGGGHGNKFLSPGVIKKVETFFQEKLLA